MDVVASSAGDRARQRHLDNGMDTVIDATCAEASRYFGVTSWFRRTDGDSVTFVVPASVPKSWLISTFLRTLEIQVHQFNRHLNATSKLRLRVAISDGEVIVDNRHVGGRPVSDTARILNADQLREFMRANTGVVLGLIVTDRFYTDVVTEGELDLDPAGFTPVTVQVKDFTGRAWIRMPAPACSGSHADPIPPASPAPDTVVDILRDKGNLAVGHNIPIGC